MLADVLAKAGANLHECNAINVQMASDRRVLAILAQKMYLDVWTNFIDCSEAEQKLADLQDQADAANNLADYNPLDDDEHYDYNPLGAEQSMTHTGTDSNNATEGTDPVPAQALSARTNNTLQDLRTRFPNYGWETDDEHKDEGMTVIWPENDDPRKFGKVPINIKLEKGNTNFHVPYDWWEPIIDWMNKLNWTKKSNDEVMGLVNKSLFKITWIELALAFQIQTGFRLAHDRLDLHEQERAFRGAIKRIWNNTSQNRWNQENHQGSLAPSPRNRITQEHYWARKNWILSQTRA